MLVVVGLEIQMVRVWLVGLVGLVVLVGLEVLVGLVGLQAGVRKALDSWRKGGTNSRIFEKSRVEGATCHGVGDTMGVAAAQGGGEAGGTGLLPLVSHLQ